MLPSQPLQIRRGDEGNGSACLQPGTPALQVWEGEGEKIKGQKTNNPRNLGGGWWRSRACSPTMQSGMLRVPVNIQNRLKQATHLSAREYEHKSRPSCRHPPGEEGPQQGLEHRAVALEHAGYSCVQRSKTGSAGGGPFQGHPMFQGVLTPPPELA